MPASTRRLSRRPLSIKEAMGTMHAPSVMGMLKDSRRLSRGRTARGVSSGFWGKASKAARLRR